jgi:hypothetical protein
MPRDFRAIPEYADCARCGEHYRAALRWVRAEIVCANCADTRHPQACCTICATTLPCQAHHVGSKHIYPHFTTWLCLNCHRILTARQYHWRRDGSAERHPLGYLLRGTLDVVELWLERSPVADRCRSLLLMLAQAAVYALPHLHPAALVEVAACWRETRP